MGGAKRSIFDFGPRFRTDPLVKGEGVSGVLGVMRTLLELLRRGVLGVRGQESWFGVLGDAEETSSGVAGADCCDMVLYVGEMLHWF